MDVTKAHPFLSSKNKNKSQDNFQSLAGIPDSNF